MNLSKAIVFAIALSAIGLHSWSSYAVEAKHILASVCSSRSSDEAIENDLNTKLDMLIYQYSTGMCPSESYTVTAAKDGGDRKNKNPVKTCRSFLITCTPNAVGPESGSGNASSDDKNAPSDDIEE